MRTPLTEDQVSDLQRCVDTWLNIRLANGLRDNPSFADMVKSCLLGRMLIQGKPPHDRPPPRAYSAPWYELIEKNGADLAKHDVYGPRDTPKGTVFNICQYVWRVLRITTEGELLGYVIECDNAEGEWTLRHRNPTDPQVKAGMSRQSDGSWAPFFYGEQDWVLVGPGDHPGRTPGGES